MNIEEELRIWKAMALTAETDLDFLDRCAFMDVKMKNYLKDALKNIRALKAKAEPAPEPVGEK